MSYNNTKTYIEYNLVHRNEKRVNYGFTGVMDQCSECLPGNKFVIGQGYGTRKPDPPIPSWIYHCQEHFDRIAAKKQTCNQCNPKSKIGPIPKMCKECYQHLYDNNVRLMDICKYPAKTVEECNCEFCQIR